MLPMVTVAGTRRARLFNPMWGRAVAPSQWWQGAPQPAVRATPTQVRSGCYKVSGGCHGGDKLVGYDNKGNAVCCPGMAGPLVRNPPPAPTPYEECRAFCYDNPQIKNCIATHCAWLKGAEPKKSKGFHPLRALRQLFYPPTGSPRRLNAMTILAGDLAFSPPTTSRLLNRARARLAAPGGVRSPGCWKTVNGKAKYVVPCPDTKFR